MNTTIVLFESHGALFAAERNDTNRAGTLTHCGTVDGGREHCPACDYPNHPDALRCLACGASLTE